ncbi:MAG TPA: GFA family protein, partial [Azonexus sp.]
MHKGSCLCGTVEYEINSPLGPIVYCHCSRCRKANGSAFTAASPVAAADFCVVKGQESLRTYTNATSVHRVFCGTCGSPIITKRDSQPDTVRVRIGTLDTPV